MKTVMVVEDDRATLELLEIVLSDAGYRPVLLLRSDDVPSVVAAEKPDLILLDILLEPKHGMEVLDSMAEEPHPPVILMSAAITGVREMGEIARALGCFDFIEKPFDVTDLLQRMESAMALSQQKAA